MELLSVDKVSCSYSASANPSAGILNKISLHLYAGEFLVVFGRSGGGKTTLLRLLNRLETPSSGSIFFQGRSIEDYSPAELRRRVTLISQRPVMFPGSACENVLLASRLTGCESTTKLTECAQDYLAECHLPPEFYARSASELSVGQQQRIALARALMLQPSVLLADEPTSALDRPTAALIMQNLRRYSRQQGAAALMVSHDLALAAEYADRLLFLEGGRVVEQGAPDKMINDPQTAALRAFLSNAQQGDGDD